MKMKSKFIAPLALLLWLGVTGWLASMVATKPAVLRSNRDAEDTAAMAQVRLGIERNKQMLAAIEHLGTLGSQNAAGPLVALAPKHDARAEALEAAQQVPPSKVSLVLSAGNSRSAVVDNQPVRVGQRLDNGARVRAIGSDWVRIDDPVRGGQTLRVPGPAADAEGSR